MPRNGRLTKLLVLLAIPATATPFLCAQTARPASYETCRALVHHGKQSDAERCFTSLTRRSDAFSRAEGFWGLERYEDANAQFRIAYRQQSRSTLVRVEWGKLFFERFNAQEAANLFNEALQIDQNYASAYLGLARVAALGYDKKAVEFARQAAAHDPKLFEAHELLAYLALEDSDEAAARKEAQDALAISGEALDALSILAAADLLEDKSGAEWFDKVFKQNPVYGQAYATAGHFFVINRRYDEGVGFYRKAVEMSPKLWPARSELGLNLMRLGKIDEARRELTLTYNAGYRNAETVNSLRVIDSLKDYQTISSPTLSLVLQKKEAALVRPYVEAELKKSIAIYERKYKMKLPGPVRLEVYPNHEDFIVRTLGLPGQGGLLGVTFGLVVAMDSPSARAPGELNWAATIRHELSHVYVVTATKHRVPRWFAEGLAVHEESATGPHWGDRMTPEIVQALEQKKLLPVSKLERGFVRPEYPTQVLVSYFQAGKMCDFIAQRWGDDALLGMIHSFTGRKTTEQAIAENLHVPPDTFDRDFNAWLDQQTHGTVQGFSEWRKRMEAAHASAKNGKLDQAIRESTAAKNLYRDYVQGGNAYELLANSYLAQGNTAAAIAHLETYRDLGGKDLSALKKLADLEEKEGQPNKAIDTLSRTLDIFLGDEEIHRKLGALELSAGDAPVAVREFQAVLALQPSDAAQSHYDLAKALVAAQRPADARDEVLLALEAAPGFKPAQQLLLNLSK